MTVYSENPAEVALDFRQAGATHLHLVDLEGAKFGTTSNLDMIRRIVETAQLSTEVGGGIRSMETVDRYLELGVDRVILGTAAVTDRNFLTQALEKHGKKIAVGVDIKDGYVAIRGWTEKSALSANDFFDQMQELGVSTVICTDISRDGAMQGTNRELYKELSRRYTIDLIASGGVSSLEDIKAIRSMDLYGAIIGKAYYTGAVDLTEALEVAK
jgi:phosphoribosylformimino-5-aminoimidazole carboxamide ribotide isomerase